MYKFSIAEKSFNCNFNFGTVPNFCKILDGIPSREEKRLELSSRESETRNEVSNVNEPLPGVVGKI